MLAKHTIGVKREPGTIYPGEYTVMPADASALKRALCSKETTLIEPQADMRELPDHFRIELLVPGLCKEDFFITTSNRKLHVSAVARQSGVGGQSLSAGVQSIRSCYRRIIQLPANVDPDFVEAGYENGILHICLFKTTHPGKIGAGQIVVY